MGDPERLGAQTVALALLGAVLFSRPILEAFQAGDGGLIFGIPPLYLYLFVAWGALVALMALLMERSGGPRNGSSDPPASKERDGY